MPWFPDFVGAAELARVNLRSAGRADPVRQYFEALTDGDPDELETVWPGSVVVYDPRAGEVRGHKQLRQFVRRNRAWLAERDAQIETVASTCTGGRAAVELLAHLKDRDGREVAWPLAVVAESADERSVVFRTYCSQWPVDGQRHVRPSILDPAPTGTDGVVGRYHAALRAGDAGAAVETFTPDGYLREPVGPSFTHRGTDELTSYFTSALSEGGIGIESCVLTDDGDRCAVEYNCVSWGEHALPPQAGVCVFERGSDSLLAAARVYDDIEAPSRP